MSGRYRLEALSGHWVPWNREGMCSLPMCWKTNNAHKGTLEAFLMSCPSLSHTRASLTRFNVDFLSEKPDLFSLVRECVMLDPVQFWLDCSTMSQVIVAVQKCDRSESVLYPLFKLTRNFCHTLHKERMNLLRE